MQTQIANDEYKIGAVSKITGIGTETLRAWERRYKAVVPKRSESGDRVYDAENLSKLFMLKNLVDVGNSIGTIAHLSLSELKVKWENSNQAANSMKWAEVDNFQPREFSRTQKCRVLLLGEEFPLRVLDGMSDFEGIEVVEQPMGLDEWAESKDDNPIHVVIIERPTINSDTREYISQILKRTGAWHVIALYGFGSQSEINKLQSPQVSAIRSSIDVYELARLCVDRVGGDSKFVTTTAVGTVYMEESIPTRRYSSKQLESLSRFPSSIQCECPQHISDLIKNLVAFEIYSAECENKNDDDARLHSFLHATTAQSRAILEDALAHLLKYENISI